MYRLEEAGHCWSRAQWLLLVEEERSSLQPAVAPWSLTCRRLGEEPTRGHAQGQVQAKIRGRVRARARSRELVGGSRAAGWWRASGLKVS